MKVITRTAVPKRVVMREDDVALVETDFADTVISETADEVETVIESRVPHLIFSET